MSLDLITNHVDVALGNLLQQYKEKPKIAALVTAIVGPVQTVEDAVNGMLTLRTIDGAVGVQLDKIGVIVGQARSGSTDDAYRIRIKIRIIQNLSQGEPDTLITVYQALTNSDFVNYEEAYPAGIRLFSGGDIPAGQETTTWENIQEVAAAGVRVNSIATANSSSPFCFLGGNIVGGGFGDKNNSNIGGPMAQKRIPTGLVFAFAGGSPNNLGFGDRRDPIMGGHLVGA